jgi:hypothetical protein
MHFRKMLFLGWELDGTGSGLCGNWVMPLFFFVVVNSIINLE